MTRYVLMLVGCAAGIALSSCVEQTFDNMESLASEINFNVTSEEKVVRTNIDEGEVQKSETFLLQNQGKDSLYLHISVADSIASTIVGNRDFQTRGVPISPQNDNFLSVHRGFGVTAYLSDNSTYMQDVEVNIFDTQKWNPVTEYYWPGKESLSFFAYAPYLDANNTDIDFAIDYTQSDAINKELVFSYAITHNSSSATACDAERQPDLMLAHTECTKMPDGGIVPLHFAHALSAVKFATQDITGGTIKDIKISNIYGAGVCTYKPMADTPITWEMVGNADSAYTQTFDIKVADEQYERQDITEVRPEATFMLIPQVLTDATVEIYMETSGGDNIVLTGNIGGNGREWLAGHTYTYVISSSSVNWTYKFEVSSLITPELGKLSTTYSVNSYRYRTNAPNIKEAVKWEAEFVDDSYAGVAQPSWVTDITLAGNGTQGTKQQFPLTLESREVTTDCPEDMELRSRAMKGSASSPYDLSLHDLAGNSIKQTTANCYIVNSPGYYKLPLVYGNARKNGANNTTAYDYQGTTSATTPNRFHDHAGANITQPYIYSKYTADNACLIWQDAYNIIENVHLSDDKKYLIFYVPRKNLQQGNAIVAARTADNTILWSWHIWVTGADMSQTIAIDDYDDASIQYHLAPVNLGWCDAKNVSFAPRSAQIKFTQEGTNSVGYMRIEQEEYSIHATCGNNTYYQFGRKDPIVGILNHSETVKTHYVEENQYVYTIKDNTNITLKDGIKNPHVFYAGSGAQDWLSSNYKNLWDNQEYQKSYKVSVKTIYDPSPIGFKIPPRHTFRIFDKTGNDDASTTDISNFNGLILSDYLYEFYPKKNNGGTPFQIEATGERAYKPIGNLATGDNMNPTYIYLWTSYVRGANAAAGLAIGPESGGFFLWATFPSTRSMARPARPVTE